MAICVIDPKSLYVVIGVKQAQVFASNSYMWRQCIHNITTDDILHYTCMWQTHDCPFHATEKEKMERLRVESQNTDCWGMMGIFEVIHWLLLYPFNMMIFHWHFFMHSIRLSENVRTFYFFIRLTFVVLVCAYSCIIWRWAGCAETLCVPASIFILYRLHIIRISIIVICDHGCVICDGCLLEIVFEIYSYR